MMVVFGGRLGEPSKSAPLKDTWGLRMHRQGNWDWVSAPYISTGAGPASRYQHSTHFLMTLMLVIGGRQNEAEESHALDIYDTETSEWYEYKTKNSDTLKRFRHSSFINQQHLYIHGGFIQSEPTYPTDSFVRVNLYEAFATVPGIDRYFITEPRSVNVSNRPSRELPRAEEEPRGKTATPNSIRLCHEVFEARIHPDDEDRKMFKRVPLN
jgi:protein phosphatase